MRCNERLQPYTQNSDTFFLKSKQLAQVWHVKCCNILIYI